MRKKKYIRRLKTMAGVPLAIGTLAFVSGKLPSGMGTAMGSAIQPAVPLTGAVVGISALGMAMDATKDLIKTGKKVKYKKRLKGGRRKW